MNQHTDEYPEKYYNYYPVAIESVGTYPPNKPIEPASFSTAQKEKSKTKYNDVWDLDNEQIFFGLKLLNKNYSIKKHEQLHITYGERSNSFLIVEYGFTLKNNQFDFVRRKELTIGTFYPEISTEVNDNVSKLYSEKLR